MKRTNHDLEAARPEVVLSQCPHCGDQSGYFVKAKVIGMTRVFYRFNGEVDDNGDMYDTIRLAEQKSKFCQSCEKKL